MPAVEPNGTILFYWALLRNFLGFFFTIWTTNPCATKSWTSLALADEMKKRTFKSHLAPDDQTRQAVEGLRTSNIIAFYKQTWNLHPSLDFTEKYSTRYNFKIIFLMPLPSRSFNVSSTAAIFLTQRTEHSRILCPPSLSPFSKFEGAKLPKLTQPWANQPVLDNKVFYSYQNEHIISNIQIHHEYKVQSPRILYNQHSTPISIQCE